MEVAEDLGKEVESFVEGNLLQLHPGLEDGDPCGRDTLLINQMVVQLGHIINLAIRCSPRGVQHTVRLNIVKEAVGKYCRVTMTEETDERTQRTYHKIHITPRS
jgi:hypothetical protein